MASTITRKLFTMGGGGFSEEPDNPLLDKYFFALTQRPRPKVCFVPTASGDAQGYIDRFYASMKTHDVEPSHLSLFRGKPGSLRDFVFKQDLIYVGGGNTRNLLVLWREWGLDAILRDAYQAGIVLGGISAGSICWYEFGLTDSIPGELKAWPCLGILQGSHSPHYDGEVDRRPAFQAAVANGLAGGIACDNGVAAVFENEQLVEFVSSRPHARAFRLTSKNGRAIETPIQPRYLGR